MALNRVILFGRLTHDPEIRQTPSGVAVAKISVACDRQFANKQTGERECDFIEVQAWRQTADFISRYFHKGDAITVEGSLRNNNYEDKNGTKHYSYVVMADNVGFGGSKSQNQGQAVQQQGNYQQAAPQPAQNAGNLSVSNLNEFEDIIIEGQLPF